MVKLGKFETHAGTDGKFEGIDGIDGIDMDGFRITGLMPFFFISLSSPLRLAIAFSSAFLPACLSAAS